MANYYGTTSPGTIVWTTNPTIGICIPHGDIYNYTGTTGFTTVFDKQYKATISFTDVSGSPLQPNPASLTLQPQGGRLADHYHELLKPVYFSKQLHGLHSSMEESFGVMVHYQNQQFGPHSSSVVGSPPVTLQISASISSPNTTTTAIDLAIFGIALFMKC